MTGCCQGAVAGRGRLLRVPFRGLAVNVCTGLPDLVGPAEPPARLHGDLWHGDLWHGNVLRAPTPRPSDRPVRVGLHQLFRLLVHAVLFDRGTVATRNKP